ncbi:MAG: biotin transporter BioY [Paracoccaceae bacterium]|nr:biotin transporter BioY [Loktanella sp.]
MTLTQAAFGTDTILKKAGLVLAGSLLIAIAAQIKVPMWPVPLSLQTLAILSIALAFGSRMGAITVVAYLAQGLAGLPVFASFGSGPAYFAGPTAGFLVGFVGMAYVAGLFAERSRSFGVMLLGAATASALLYLPGMAWPLGLASAFGIDAGWAGLSLSSVWSGFVAPFILGDVIKSVLAALIVAGGWTAFAKR